MIYQVSYAIAGFAWLALAVAGLLFGAQRRHAFAFSAASSLQAGWAIAAWLGFWGLGPSVLFEIGRTVAWAVFFALLLPGSHRVLQRTIVLIGLALIAIRTGVPALEVLSPVARLQLALMSELLAVILALCMNVAVFHASGETARWSLKFLCFPLAGLFVYDLFIYGQMLSVGLPSAEYLAARAALAVVSAPFVLVAAWRSRIWAYELQFSRQAALYSVALVAVGLYLLAVAGATLLIEHGSIRITPTVQIGLLFASALLLMILLQSGRFRAKLKLLVSRHFYARKYDYAHEWRKFMQTLAFEGTANPLENRIIRACADLLEVPGGALWVMEGGRPRLHATWNYRVTASTGEPLPERIFEDRQGKYSLLHGQGLAAAPFAKGDEQAWLAVPLPHDGALLGFLLLSHPRVQRTIDVEDSELLMLIAYQCASYLAEKRAAAELENERQFARFNRQYAFVAHDIKNLVSQLAVMLKNFDRHADNPEFQRDMQDTVSNAVDRMRGILNRLGRMQNRDVESDGGGEEQQINPAEIVQNEVARWGAEDGGKPEVAATPAARGRGMSLARDRFAEVLRHLLNNAREASGPDGRIKVDLDVAGGCLLLDVTDNGPGMTQDFVRDSLFAPFRSTKHGGFGVGVYQCREFAREHGGDLEAISSPGSGTTMRLRLPMAEKNSRSDVDGSDFDTARPAIAGR